MVSGNGGSGIYVLGATNVTVRGNFLGLDATGTAAMGNGQDGVVIHNSSGSYCTIGGTAAGAGNVISGNANGIYILGALTNWILGNFVGTDASGTRALGNTQSGITIFGGHGSQVGGTAAGAANRVCFNQQRGVGVSADATACEIRGNAIFANRGPGIDLNADGVSTNDFYDLDLGANETQNHPVLTNALVGASTVRVQGYLEGAAGVTLTLDFYASTNWDFDGLAEGQSWLGAASITTDAAGLAVFDTTLVAAVPAGAQITGTATDAGGNTSEFSPAALAGAGSPAPPLGLVSLGGTNYLAWPADAAGVSLEASLALGPSASWFRVSSGIVTLGGHLVFPIVPAPGVGHQFFRLVAE